MNSPMERPRSHNINEEAPHPNVGLQQPGEGHDDHEHHGEKKSVLKKVKDKAKKIKDTIKGHVGHGHELDHGHDEDEEMEDDVEVHGDASTGHEDDEATSRVGEYQTFDPTTTTYIPGQEKTLGWSRTDTGGPHPIGSEERPYAPNNTPVTLPGTGTGRMSGQLAGILTRPTRLDKDPQAPQDGGQPGNNQTKVTDPTGRGGKEAGVAAIVHQLDKMEIHDEPSQKAKITGQEESLIEPSLGHKNKLTTGSHDQFSPEPITPETSTFLQDPVSEPRKQEGSYTEKITSAASMVAYKAKQATSVVTSKLGYGGTTGDQHPTEPSMEASYGLVAMADKVSQAKDVVVDKLLSPVVDKVAEVGSTVSSKVQGSGKESEEVESTKVAAADKGVSVKEYLAEKLKPSEEDKALSEVITEALPNLHDKRKEEESSEIKGRVTESEQVAKQLGSINDSPSHEDTGSGLASPGKGMLDRLIKGAAASWFGKGGGDSSPSPQGSSDTSKGNGNSHST